MAVCDNRFSFLQYLVKVHTSTGNQLNISGFHEGRTRSYSKTAGKDNDSDFTVVISHGHKCVGCIPQVNLLILVAYMVLPLSASEMFLILQEKLLV